MRIVVPNGSLGEEKAFGERRIIGGYIIIEIEDGDEILSINDGEQALVKSSPELTVLFRGLKLLPSRKEGKMAKEFDSKGLIEALEKSGLHPTIVKVKLTPEQRKRERYVERVVRNYIMRIEKGHKMAAHSTLCFK